MGILTHVDLYLIDRSGTGCRIRVTDQSGAMVALVGVATALRFGSAALGGSS
jgi:hypothetical protein